MPTQTHSALAPYKPKNYSHLLGMKGFSEKLLKDHFKLYEGYVKNSNEMIEKLSHVTQRETPSIELNEVRRRFGWEFNGMRLHEYYFDNLGGQEPIDSEPGLTGILESNFGSVEKWKKDFIATGGMRGIGWAALYQDLENGRLFNFWIEEHNINHLAGSQPLLIMDVFEHAFMTDYGTDRAKYMEAFFNNVDWKQVAGRQKMMSSGA